MSGWARRTEETRAQSGGDVPMWCTACASKSLSDSVRRESEEGVAVDGDVGVAPAPGPADMVGVDGVSGATVGGATAVDAADGGGAILVAVLIQQMTKVNRERWTRQALRLT